MSSHGQQVSASEAPSDGPSSGSGDGDGGDDGDDDDDDGGAKSDSAAAEQSTETAEGDSSAPTHGAAVLAKPSAFPKEPVKHRHFPELDEEDEGDDDDDNIVSCADVRV